MQGSTGSRRRGRRVTSSTYAFEILYRPLVLFGGCTRGKCSQVSALPRSRIFLPRVEAVFAGRKFTNHRSTSSTRINPLSAVIFGPPNRAPSSLFSWLCEALVACSSFATFLFSWRLVRVL